MRVRFIAEAAENVTLAVRILCFRFFLYPKRVKQPDPRKFTKKRFERMLRRQKKKAEKKAAKKTAKTEKKAKKEKEEKKTSAADTIRLVLRLLSAVFPRFVRYLRLDVSRLIVTVSTDDAAKTAIAYGAVSQAAAYLSAFLDSYVDLRHPPAREERIECDFLSGKTSCDIHITASMRVWQIFVILVVAAYHFLAAKSKSKP